MNEENIICIMTKEKADDMMHQFLDEIEDYVLNKNHSAKFFDGGQWLEVVAIMNYVSTIRGTEYLFTLSSDEKISWFCWGNHLEKCIGLNDLYTYFKMFYRKKNVIKDVFR